MPTLRRATWIDAPARTVAGVLRDVAFVHEVARRTGRRAVAEVRLLSAGDEVRTSGVVLQVVAVGAEGTELRGADVRLVVRLTPTAAGTTVLDEIDDAGGTSDAVRALLSARADVLAQRVTALIAAPVVVATALVRDGRVLAARRTRPPALAGRWELPGGRVEPGETEVAAVVRECREELGTSVIPDGRLGTDLPIDAGVLRVHRASLAPGAPEPRALEHSGLRWVSADEVASMDWVDADRAVVDDLVALLGTP